MKRHLSYNLILQICVAAHFAFSALSPVYLTVYADSGIVSPYRQQDPAKSIRVGIAWLKNILQSVTNKDPDDVNGDGKPEGNQMLAPGTDALARASFRIRPLPLIGLHFLPAASPKPLLALRQYCWDTPRQPRLHECDGYPSLNTGLSPPLFLA